MPVGSALRVLTGSGFVQLAFFRAPASDGEADTVRNRQL